MAVVKKCIYGSRAANYIMSNNCHIVFAKLLYYYYYCEYYNMHIACGIFPYHMYIDGSEWLLSAQFQFLCELNRYHTMVPILIEYYAIISIDWYCKLFVFDVSLGWWLKFDWIQLNHECKMNDSEYCYGRNCITSSLICWNFCSLVLSIQFAESFWWMGINMCHGLRANWSWLTAVIVHNWLSQTFRLLIASNDSRAFLDKSTTLVWSSASSV